MRIKIARKGAEQPKTVVRAYGGTAAKFIYCEPIGEPYLKGKTHYIKVKYNGAEKEVRWYNDKDSHEMYRWHSKVPKKPLWSFFLFSDENDKILIARDPKVDLSDEYFAEYVHKMHSAGWQLRSFYGGAWIAKKGKKIPKGIGLLSEEISWDKLKRAGQVQSDKLGYSPNGEGIWYED